MKIRGAVFGAVASVVIIACSSDGDPAPGTTGADAGTGETGAAAAASVAACPGVAFVASCQAPDHCFDIHGPPKSTAQLMCSAAVGTLKDTPCATAGHVGGCDAPSTGMCTVHWYFSPTYKADKVKSGCGGTYHAP